MVTDRVGPTITTLKAEVDYLDGEVKKLLNLLADARTESMKLRAALEPILNYPGIKDKIGSVLYDAGYAALSALEGK